jgi:hypothetical protein
VYLKYIAQRVKNWEGRTVTQVLSKLRRMMIEGDTVCLLAGKYVVWCKVVQVVHKVGCAKEDIETVVTKSAWMQFAPWCASHEDAVDLYVKMGDGSGYVFMELQPPYKMQGLQPSLQ